MANKTLSSKRIGDGISESLTYHHEDVKEAINETLKDLYKEELEVKHFIDMSKIDNIFIKNFGDELILGDEQ